MVRFEEYYTLVKLKASGGCEFAPLTDLTAFVAQQYASLPSGISEQAFQTHLMRIWRSDATSPELRCGAEKCLRCKVSNCLWGWGKRRANQLSSTYRYPDIEKDLWGLVLLDDGEQSYNSDSRFLWQRILRTYNPERDGTQAGLCTWADLLAKQDDEVKRFFKQELGLVNRNSWQLLNQVKLHSFHNMFKDYLQSVDALSEQTRQKIQSYPKLLEVYQKIYPQKLLEQRTCSRKREYPPPNPQQLQEMLSLLKDEGIVLASKEALLARLKEVTALLQERMSLKEGKRPDCQTTIPLETGNVEAGELQVALEKEISQAVQQQGEQEAWLLNYEAKIPMFLDQAIETVLSQHISKIRRNAAYNSQQYLRALGLLHCGEKTMTAIADEIGLRTQEKVSRMLKLKQLRAEISREMQSLLFDALPELVGDYMDEPERLLALNDEIRVALEESVNPIFEEAQKAMNTDPICRPKTLFAERICQYITRREVQ